MQIGVHPALGWNNDLNCLPTCLMCDNYGNNSIIEIECVFYEIQPLKGITPLFWKLNYLLKTHHKIIAPFAEWEMNFFKWRIKMKCG